jgi:phage repressor protein C with HTH and peptisase S24 domain
MRMAGADESQIYRELMRFKPVGLSPNAWAVKAGVSRTVWADMRRHGNPSRRTLEKLLTAAGSSLAEFEALHIGAEPGRLLGRIDSVGESAARGWSPAPLPPLPLLVSILAGEWGGPGSGIELVEIRRGEGVDRVPRPASLVADKDAYAITVVGDSMWPRFRPGRRVAVSPRSAVAVGDDVLVILKGHRPGDANLALLKELVRRTSTDLELRQFNPDIGVKVSTADVEAIHKVAGELI